MARQMAQGRTANVVVRAARLDADHRDPDALARRVPQAGRAPDQAHRDEQGNRPDREARVQAPLEHRAVGRAGTAGLEELAPRPAGRQTATGRAWNCNRRPRLADRASTDAEFMQVAALYRGRPDFDVAALVAELVEAESVPFLPVLRYKATGLRKRAVWERTWELQRQEDAGEGRRATSPCRPSTPRPTSSSPTSGGCGASSTCPRSGSSATRTARPTATPRWSSAGPAGTTSSRRGPGRLLRRPKREGWDARRLAPLLAGLDQLVPWLHQWHPEDRRGVRRDGGPDRTRPCLSTTPTNSA